MTIYRTFRCRNAAKKWGGCTSRFHGTIEDAACADWWFFGRIAVCPKCAARMSAAMGGPAKQQPKKRATERPNAK